MHSLFDDRITAVAKAIETKADVEDFKRVNENVKRVKDIVEKELNDNLTMKITMLEDKVRLYLNKYHYRSYY